MGAVTSSDKRVIEITLPDSWEKLSQKQLYEAYRFLSSNLTAEAVMVHAFMRWGGFRVIGADTLNLRFMIQRKNEKPFLVSTVQVAEAMQCLKFLAEVPKSPVRLEKIGKFNAADARLRGLTLEDYIACDNSYQGYLSTKRDDLLERMAKILYRAENIKLDPAQRLSVLYWWISVKDYLSREYCNLFGEAENDSNLLGDFRSTEKKLKDNVNAQIRALTKGDVTKEEAVINLDVHRAFAELDAQAREYREMKAKYNLK